MKKLITRLNEEKKILKKEGITVDGIHYKITFTGTQLRLNLSAETLGGLSFVSLIFPQTS